MLTSWAPLGWYYWSWSFGEDWRTSLLTVFFHAQSSFALSRKAFHKVYWHRKVISKNKATITKTTKKQCSALEKFSVKSVNHLWKRDISLGFHCYELLIENILIEQMAVHQALCVTCSTCCTSFNLYKTLLCKPYIRLSNLSKFTELVTGSAWL